MATASKKARPKSSAKKAHAAKPAAAKAKAKASPPTKRVGKPAEPDVEEPERSSAALAEVDAEVLEFIAAIDTFKKQHGRPFPSWSEVLLIVRQLGYRRS